MTFGTLGSQKVLSKVIIFVVSLVTQLVDKYLRKSEREVFFSIYHRLEQVTIYCASSNMKIIEVIVRSQILHQMIQVLNRVGQIRNVCHEQGQGLTSWVAHLYLNLD